MNNILIKNHNPKPNYLLTNMSSLFLAINTNAIPLEAECCQQSRELGVQKKTKKKTYKIKRTFN